MDKDKIVDKLIEKIKSLQDGTEVSILWLLNHVFHCKDKKDDFYVYDDFKLISKDLFEISSNVIKKSKDEGIFLDFSKNKGLMIGLPYSVTFVKRKIAK